MQALKAGTLKAWVVDGAEIRVTTHNNGYLITFDRNSLFWHHVQISTNLKIAIRQ